MDQQQHMTKTEAHPYHHGRGMKVYDPNCPLCREGHQPEIGTYVSWSLHETALQRAEQLQAILERITQQPSEDGARMKMMALEALNPITKGMKTYQPMPRTS